MSQWPPDDPFRSVWMLRVGYRAGTCYFGHQLPFLIAYEELRMPSPAADTCLMYLVRHGATVANLENPPRLQGRGVNHGLSEIGWGQAEQTSQLLSRLKLSAVHSSSMQRALDTAGKIAEPHGLPVQSHETLVEVNVGRWEAKSWDEIQRDDPEGYRGFTEAPHIHGYPGGETMADLLARVRPTLEQIAEQHLGQEIATVTHAVVNRTLLAHVLGLPPQAGRIMSQENCAVNVLRYRKGEFKVRTMNSALHLAD